MSEYDKVRNELLAELDMMLSSESFNNKPVLLLLIGKYKKTIYNYKEEDIKVGLEYLRLDGDRKGAAGPDENLLNHRKAAFSDAIKNFNKEKKKNTFGKKEYTSSRIDLHINKGVKEDVWLYIRESGKENKKKIRLNSNTKEIQKAPIVKINEHDAVIYYDEIDIRNTFKYGFLFQVIYVSSFLTLLFLAIKFFGLSERYYSYQGLFYRTNSSLLFVVSILFFLLDFLLIKFTLTKFSILFGRLFMKKTKNEVLFLSYSGKCPICFQPVHLELSKYMTYIGKCEQDPVNHRFSFNHTTCKGMKIMRFYDLLIQYLRK